MRLRLSTIARSHLVEIRVWTETTWGEAKAQSYLGGLADALERLKDHPQLGRRRPELGEDLRSVTYKRHVIYYVHTGQDLLIVGVLHSRRDVRSFDPREP